MGAILKAGNSSFEQVVKTTVLMKSMDDYAKINQVYSQCMYMGLRIGVVGCSSSGTPSQRRRRKSNNPV